VDVSADPAVFRTAQVAEVALPLRTPESLRYAVAVAVGFSTASLKGADCNVLFVLPRRALSITALFKILCNAEKKKSANFIIKTAMRKKRI